LRPLIFIQTIKEFFNRFIFLHMPIITKYNCMGVFCGIAELVQHVLKSYHEISDEISRWRLLLEVSYQEYLRTYPS